MDRLKQTPTQTIGPFFAYGLTPQQYDYDFSSLADGNLIDPQIEGEIIRIRGIIYDGNGTAVEDAMIELWQADANGNYHQYYQLDNFRGFGRLGTGTTTDRSFNFKTIKPGSVNGQAPHINVILFMRGSLHTLYTRLYFSDEMSANEQDTILSKIPKDRQQTLIAQRKEQDNIVSYHFDIHMQGALETVFFQV